MATVAESLFGITPESLLAERDRQARAQALQVAQLDPLQQARFSGSMAASRLGTGIGGLLGAQDPEMMRVTQRQSLLQGVDPTSIESLQSAAQQAMANQDFTLAQELAKRIQDMQVKQAQVAKDTAAAARERAPQIPADIAKAQRIAAIQQALPVYEAQGDKDTVKLLTNELNALLPAGTKPSFGAEAERVSLELYKKPFSQLTQTEMAAVNKRVDETTKRGTTVNVSVSGQEKFAEKMGELDAKRVADAVVARDNAFATVRSLDQLASLDDQGLISGTFATGRVGATNLLNTLGLASPADQAKLASSQNYQKVAGDVILGVLGGKLGAGFSNEDRKFIEGLVPQLETSPMARRQLITFMRSKNMAIAEETTRLENYARNNNGLKGFTPKFPIGANIPATAMSADDLAKAAGGKIVNGKFVPNK